MKNDPWRYWKAHIFGSVFMVGALMLGLILGGWIAAGFIVLLSDGAHSLSDFNRQWVVFPGTPKWLSPVADRLEFSLVGIGSLIAGLVGLIALGRLGARIDHYLVVKKFKWLTEEDVKKSNKTQWM